VERQERELLAQGYRVITYDRRGFGRSSQPTIGYDYDTFRRRPERADRAPRSDRRCARRLLNGERRSHALPQHLRLEAGAQGCAARNDPPFVLKTEDNPEGVDGQVFEGIQAAIVQDRYAFFEGFLNTFNNFDVLGGSRISDRAWQASFNVAVAASRSRATPASAPG